MIEYLNNIDSSVYLFFNGMHAPFFDNFMSIFTGRVIWIPMYVAIFYLISSTYGVRRVWVFAVGIGIAILLTDQLCATYIRPFCERLRPSNPENPLSFSALLVNNYRGGSYGFPSCHAANSFALATFLSMLMKNRKITLFIFGWATLNSYSRLYLGVHYPGDLLAGALIGSAIGATICYVSLYADKKLFMIEHSIPPKSSQRVEVPMPSIYILWGVGAIITLAIAVASVF